MGNNSSQDENDKVGYRVLGVQPNSPAACGGLVSFFDFIIAANGVPLRSLDPTFVELIKVLALIVCYPAFQNVCRHLKINHYL